MDEEPENICIYKIAVNLINGIVSSDKFILKLL